MRIDNDSPNGPALALTPVNLFRCQLLFQQRSSPVNTMASVDELVFYLQEHVPVLGDRRSAFMEQSDVWQKLQLIFGASTSSFFLFFPPPRLKSAFLFPPESALPSY